MPDSTQLAAACLEVVSELAQRGRAWRAKQTTTDQLDCIDYLDRTFPQLAETTLTGWTAAPPPAGDFGDKWVHGPPALGKDKPKVLTVARLKWDFLGTEDTVQLIVGLVVRNAEFVRKYHRVPMTAYRFETGRGTHHYAHAQPTTHVTPGGQPIDGAPHQMMNESSPAFPLDCTGPCGIVASAALSIMGSTDFTTMVNGSTQLRDALRPFRAQLPRRLMDPPVTR